MSENIKDAFIEKVLENETKKLFWGNIFKALFALYLFIGAGMMAYLYTDFLKGLLKEKDFSDNNHIAVIKVEGVIDSGDKTFQKYSGAIRYAFENEASKAVVLQINSPGGSPVQSNKIYDWVKNFKETSQKPVYAIVEDIAASGGYYIALSADNIYANKSSLVGSIGVKMETYNVSSIAQKLGVEKRNFVTGMHKDIGDPFKQVSNEQEQLIMASLNDVFEEFKDTVIESRGDRLDQSYELLFSGMFWSGKTAQKYGLIDGFDTLEALKSKHGVERAFLYNSDKQPLIKRLLGIDISAQDVMKSLTSEFQVQLR